MYEGQVQLQERYRPDDVESLPDRVMGKDTLPTVCEGACRFCRERRPLRLSHIVSSLAYRRMKRFRGPNRLVDSRAIVVQDGPKRSLLCDACEKSFGRVEHSFNERFLIPYYKAKRFRAVYGDWLPRFAAINLWRILVTLLEDGEIPSELQDATNCAERVWHSYIGTSAHNCGPHHLHLVLIDNRPEWAAYAEGVVEYGLTAQRTTDDAYLVAKLPGLAFIGVLRERSGRAWRHTRIELVEGRIDASAETQFPPVVYDYFRERLELANRTTRVDWT